LKKLNSERKIKPGGSRFRRFIDKWRKKPSEKLPRGGKKRKRNESKQNEKDARPQCRNAKNTRVTGNPKSGKAGMREYLKEQRLLEPQEFSSAGDRRGGDEHKQGRWCEAQLEKKSA